MADARDGGGERACAGAASGRRQALMRDRTAMPIRDVRGGLLVLMLASSRHRRRDSGDHAVARRARRYRVLRRSGHERRVLPIAIPEHWNRVLPCTRAVARTARLSGQTQRRVGRSGSSKATPTRRHSTGAAVRRAHAARPENLRQYFVNTFGQPRRTIMHGQSWGALVGARIIELFGEGSDGRQLRRRAA
jgi:hypothetical protein